ncbi:MAG TPA: nitrous oxide reductase family maturation protein NosD [Saprospiraceae bacterium]|nr:nitrous oxide reductase family maturation protein NosD [Saprospiraceae bacterium]
MDITQYRHLVWIGFLLFLHTHGHTHEIRVCPTCPVPSLTIALEQAVDGDHILVQAGVYTEKTIEVNKSVTIEGTDYPIIDGSNNNELLHVTADHVTIKGLHLRNVGTSYTEDRAGIRIDHAAHFLIENNKLEDAFFAIYLAYAKHGAIIRNEIRGNAENEVSSGNGIHLWYCKHIRIEKNTVTGHRDGIYFEFADSCQIRENLSIRNLRYGLHFMFSNDDVYSANTFSENGSGVAVMFSRRIAMYDNLFENNWGSASYGLLLKEIYDTEIHNNLFVRNTIGINLEGATRIRYYHNQFEGNGWALRISGGCLENAFYQNNFQGNTFDIGMQSSASTNTFDDNYWSEYTGYDLDRNGTGDVPYRPVKLFSYVISRTPEALVLLRSWFTDILNFAEKITPVLTPATVIDNNPRMEPVIMNDK